MLASTPVPATQPGFAKVPLWLLALPLLALIAVIASTPARPDGRLHVWVLDVGQGNAVLIKTPQGHTAVIDGGPAATPLLAGMGAHLPFWQRDVDLAVLTTPRPEHITGLVELLDRYHVSQVVQTEFTATAGVEQQWVYAVQQKGVPVHYAWRGEVISFDGEPDVSLRVLNPATPGVPTAQGKPPSNAAIDNASIVLQLSYGSESILLESDAEIAAEAGIVAHPPGTGLHSQALLVGNHGSATSSSLAFLRAVSPKIAIISTGMNGNKPAPPAPAALQALGEVGAAIYRTDLNGSIEVIAEKDKMWVRADKP